jgi:hypothetical protein
VNLEFDSIVRDYIFRINSAYLRDPLNESFLVSLYVRGIVRKIEGKKWHRPMNVVVGSMGISFESIINHLE